MKQPEQHIITSLLEKHALGICTPEERALLEQWYAAFPEKGQVWRDPAEKAAMKEELKAGIFETIAPVAVPTIATGNAKPIRKIWWQAAAVLAGLVATLLVYSKYSHKKEPVYISVSAPAGKDILQVQLPDGSGMWLEPGTTVRYPKDFAEDGREIELTDGKAFFFVRQQAKHPFIVSAPGGVQVKVLGTGFTVKAYRQTADVRVLVSEGSVQVSDSTGVLAILKAGQQIDYYENKRFNTRTEVVEDDWRNGNLSLDNASAEEVARILENRYGLQVTFDVTNMALFRFTLRISKTATATEVLEMLKDISGLEYTLSNGRVTIHQ